MTLDRSNLVVSSPSSVNLAPTVIVDYNISQITPYVFVTAEDTARQFPRVFSNGIGCVINVANELPYIVFPPQSGIESLKYPIEDNPAFPAAQYFDSVVDRIAANVAANRRTLLYCHHGRSRSVTFILAYLIKHHRLPLSTAFALVKQRRQLALPNVGFWSQLQSYESFHNRQKYNDSAIRNTLQRSMSFGQQILINLTGGMEQVIAQVPLISPFLSTIQSTYRPGRPRLSIRSHPYQYRYPAGLYQRV